MAPGRRAASALLVRAASAAVNRAKGGVGEGFLSSQSTTTSLSTSSSSSFSSQRTPSFTTSTSHSFCSATPAPLLLHHAASITTSASSSQAAAAASIKPPDAVYGGPRPSDVVVADTSSSSSPPRHRVTLRTLRAKHRDREPITMVTAYDYPSATHVDAAGVDVLLVGDSAAMVVHGHDTTLPVTVDEMLLHCRSVARGARVPLLVGDLPFGSYEASPKQAVESAVRIMKEGGMDSVKLEGGSGARVAAARAVVDAGVAVMGHVGLMPQAISVLGGFRPQGMTGAASGLRVLREALALRDAGVFAVVLECVPAALAAAVTEALRPSGVPTIGIGAGPHTSGQVLVYHDLLGMMAHPHYRQVTPKFCKKFAHIGEQVQAALGDYCDEVRRGQFPGPLHTPYRLDERATKELSAALRREGQSGAAEAAEGVFEKEREREKEKEKEKEKEGK